MSRKPYVSTVVRDTKKHPRDEVAEERDGVRVGQVFPNSRIGAIQVRHISRWQRNGKWSEWTARVVAADRHQESIPLSELSDIVKGRIAYPHGCYTVGKGRIRRRKVNPRASVVLYAKRPGGRLLKYIGKGKFGFKGRPLRFRDGAAAALAAWIMRDAFPDILRPYRLFWQ